MLAQLDPRLAHLGAMLAELGPASAHDADEALGAARISSMIWAYVTQCRPIWSHKPGKMEEAENTVKHTILQGSAAEGGLPSLLRRGEIAYGKDTAFGPLGPLAGL